MIIVNCSNELLLHNVPSYVAWVALGIVFFIGCWLIWLDKTVNYRENEWNSQKKKRSK